MSMSLRTTSSQDFNSKSNSSFVQTSESGMSRSLMTTTSQDFNSESNEMNVKEETSSREDEFGEEFISDIHPTQTTSIIDEIEIKHEEVDYHSNLSTPDADSVNNCDLETVSNIPHVDFSYVTAEEKDLNEFYPDLLQCERDCETCQTYIRILSEHVRSTHCPPQPIQDPLHIDHLIIDHDSPQTDQSSLIQIKREGGENIDNIENSMLNSESDPGRETASMSSNLQVDCSSVKAEEKDLNEFNFDLLQRDWNRDCESCQKYMKMLIEHVRATHAPPQPIQDPLLIHTDSPCPLESSSNQIKCEVDDGMENMESSWVKSKSNESESDSDVDSESESDPGPDYIPSPHLARNFCHRRLTKNKASSDSIISKTKKAILSSQKQFKCNGCDKRYKTKGHLTRHKRIHIGEKPHKCVECDKRFSAKYKLTKHKRVHIVGKPHKCVECEKSFSRLTNLRVHTRIHTRQKSNKCEECGLTFSLKSTLTIHIRTHTGEKVYKCDVCEKRFALHYSLKKHTRVHTGEKPYKCDVCEKCFSQPGTLTKHKRSHTGERPYTCDKCEKSYRSSNNLTIHIRMHTGERPYQCEECGLSFTSNSYLTTHKRIHTGKRPYNCDVCEKSFAMSSDLTRHKRVHTGERFYKCEECEKSFASKDNLNKHKRVHTGERPHKCDGCEKSFTRSQHLKKHKRLHSVGTNVQQ